MAEDTASPLDKVTLQDWALAAISLLFTLGGLLIIRRDFNTGIVTLVFFGLGLVHATRVILRKRRAQRQQALTASVAGGVPIRQSRGRMALLGAALLAIGVTHVAFTTHATQVAIGWLLVGVGGALLLGLALGLLSTAYIQFDPAGITFADRHGKAIVPWDAVVRLARGDMNNNPLVLVSVDMAAIDVQPAAYRPRLNRQMGRSRGLMGADFVIMSASYGLDAPVLLAALQRYVMEPASRQELQRLPRLAG